MNVRIFASYHRPARIVRSRVITPIHAGKANSGLELGMDGDDISPSRLQDSYNYAGLADSPASRAEQAGNT